MRRDDIDLEDISIVADSDPGQEVEKDDLTVDESEGEDDEGHGLSFGYDMNTEEEEKGQIEFNQEIMLDAYPRKKSAVESQGDKTPKTGELNTQTTNQEDSKYLNISPLQSLTEQSEEDPQHH